MWASTGRHLPAFTLGVRSATRTEATLNLAPTAARNQYTATCYPLDKLEEDGASIATLHAAVAVLQANQSPPPKA